jgi:hypothetical protein
MSVRILLLTSTIRPLAGIPALARTNVDDRLRDYERALEFYIGLVPRHFSRIVFVENSCFDLASLRNVVNRLGADEKVEFISFAGLDFPPEFGRGYGEFRMVDYAMGTSTAIAASSRPIIWKCTGRYIVRNLAQLATTMGSRTNLYCHMRNYPYRLCELYLLAWDQLGYETAVRGVYEKLRNNVTPGMHTIEETLFRTHVEEIKERIVVRPRFSQVPLLEGVRGWNNTPLSGTGSHPKILMRRMAQALLPHLWI